MYELALVKIEEHDAVFSGSVGISLLPDSQINGCTEIEHSINIIDELPFDMLTCTTITIFVVIICLPGLLGNGSVIWLLGFHLKRSPFTTYILNFSIADFGVLVSLLTTIPLTTAVNTDTKNAILRLFFLLFLELFFFSFSAGQFLLAAISIDRCLAVLFPLWHRCHRPPCLSRLVCALIWIVSFLLSAIHLSLQMTGSFTDAPILFQCIVMGALCAPVMVTSTVTLFVQVCCKSKQRHRGKLITAILLALLFFLLFAFPMNVFYVIHSFWVKNQIFMTTGFACASLNSSVNPLIYFLVGKREKKGKPRMSLKAALQKVFKEDQEWVEEARGSCETAL